MRVAHGAPRRAVNSLHRDPERNAICAPAQPRLPFRVEGLLIALSARPP
jgi:hypothetical protein